MNVVISPKRDRLTASARVVVALLGLVGIGLLVLAHYLEPDPRGYGTHEQLGLAPCYFQKQIEIDCPMCGGTTSWAYAVRGKWTAAANANLGAALLCVVVVVGSPWLMLVATMGRWLIGRPTLKLILVFASAWLVVVVLDWIRRIYPQI